MFENAPETKKFLLDDLSAEITSMSTQDIYRRRKNLKEAQDASNLNQVTPYKPRVEVWSQADEHIARARYICSQAEEALAKAVGSPEADDKRNTVRAVRELLNRVETFKAGRLTSATEAQDWLYATKRMAPYMAELKRYKGFDVYGSTQMYSGDVHKGKKYHYHQLTEQQRVRPSLEQMSSALMKFHRVIDEVPLYTHLTFADM